MNKKNSFITVLFLVVLVGCTVPGTHLPIGDKKVMGGQDQDELLDSIEVHPITVDVLQQLKTNADSGPQGNPALDEAVANYKYRIGKGDVLNITVWDHPELTIPAGQYRSAEEAGIWVSNEGNIFYPYIGKAAVEGKTVEEVRGLITKRLSKYIENPQVDVNVAAFRAHKVFITGEVKRPGNVPITNVPLTLLDAINQSEGLTEKADWQRVTLHRDGQDEVLSLRSLLKEGVMTENRLLRPGDIAHVGSIDDRKVYVMGSVKKAGTLPIGRNGLSLTEAISDVGGLNESEANATGVFVIRRMAKESDKLARLYQLDLSDATAMVLGVEFPLKQNDVVYVTTAPVSRWARVINQIFPTILTIDVIDNISNRN
jgi:polysaccharide export outer membrane protein